MGIKKRITSIADKITNRVDSKMLEYVSRFVDEDMSDLEKAVSIYLCLGDVLQYSPHFALTNDYSKLNMVRDINEDNNEMICKNWAILYHRLLKYFGIDTKIVRKRSHYKVEMIRDGVIYNMDATAYGGKGYTYHMSDNARIKYGFKIDRFFVSGTLEPYDINRMSAAVDELNIAISNVYERQNRKVVDEKKISKLRNKVEEFIQSHGRKVGVGSLEDLNYRITTLNRFWRLNINDSALERIQLFNSFYSTLFEDYESYGYETKCYNVYGYQNHKLKIFKLIAVEIDGMFYYLMDDGKEFKLYHRQQVVNEFSKRNMRITEFTEVMGIYTGLEYYKVRMK